MPTSSHEQLKRKSNCSLRRALELHCTVLKIGAWDAESAVLSLTNLKNLFSIDLQLGRPEGCGRIGFFWFFVTVQHFRPGGEAKYYGRYSTLEHRGFKSAVLSLISASAKPQFEGQYSTSGALELQKCCAVPKSRLCRTKFLVTIQYSGTLGLQECYAAQLFIRHSFPTVKIMPGVQHVRCKEFVNMR